MAKVDSLPNLQLLAGIPNIEKQAALPTAWLDGPHFATPEKRDDYLSRTIFGDSYWSCRRFSSSTQAGGS